MVTKQERNNFFYFVLIAPILAKVIEWGFQIFGSVDSIDFIKDVVLIQISFIIGVSLFVYFIMFNVLGKKKTNLNMASIVGISYFLKEVYNLFFIFGSSSLIGSIPFAESQMNVIILIALTLEPIFMFTILGLFLPQLIFKRKVFK